LFNVLAMVAEFERDLISMRTKEGMAVYRELQRRRVACLATCEAHIF